MIENAERLWGGQQSEQRPLTGKRYVGASTNISFSVVRRHTSSRRADPSSRHRSPVTSVGGAALLIEEQRLKSHPVIPIKSTHMDTNERVALAERAFDNINGSLQAVAKRPNDKPIRLLARSGSDWRGAHIGAENRLDPYTEFLTPRSPFTLNFQRKVCATLSLRGGRSVAIKYGTQSIMANDGKSRFKRRTFLKWTGAAVAAGAAAAGGIHLFHFRYDATDPDPMPRTTPTLGSWQDLYRQRWTWDDVKKGSHGWVNCRSACEWDLYVKNGIVVREEQTATYEQSEPGVPDFNPRGCQKGACYTEVMYGPSRITTPMKRVGERGSGQWKQISWDQAISEIAEKFVEVAQEYGTDAIYQDLGRALRCWRDEHWGASDSKRRLGACLPTTGERSGDLNFGGVLTLGAAHVGGSRRTSGSSPTIWSFG